MSKILLAQLLFTLYLSDVLIPVAVATLQENGCEKNDRKKPHIIIILADDLGWNDVSFHGSNQIPTPNIDALAYNGVILNRHYVLPICTPSRAALMTGKYPIHTGMQHAALDPSEPRGLPLNETILPQFLKEANYATYIVGKWHIGYYKHEYTPCFRGFDTCFVCWNGFQDYFSHDTAELNTPNKGIDMRRNMTISWDTRGKYVTDLYTEEAIHLINNHNIDDPMFLYLSYTAPHSAGVEHSLQAPPEEIEKFTYINDKKRRIYAAMVSKLDQGVGNVIEALKNRSMLENSIIVFMSDNGAPTNGFLANHGSNYPFRGIKDTAWEGAVRGVAAVWSPLVKNSKRVSNDLMHITDLSPTLLTVAGVKEINGKDGKNMWETIKYGKLNPRNEVLININDIFHYEAIINVTDENVMYKYVRGQAPLTSNWVGDSGRNPSEKQPPYLPATVLDSKAGAAIATVTTSNNKSALIAQDILRLRQEATVHCNVMKENKARNCTWSKPCLFDLKRDPCEKINIIEQEPNVAKNLQEALNKYRSKMLPPNNKFKDWEASPFWWNRTWVCWQDPNQQHEFINIFFTFLYYFVPTVAYFLSLSF
ncbi:arylsulfatase B-like [Odontomachus brunneus]|uniref:arylsulfatase B-like n=1 Tax=Odontomachus brunneus TaxID=486640 RepID=UPI0013F21B0F|nr:arylsulfatase B-like [Odontomachus brunneus]